MIRTYKPKSRTRRTDPASQPRTRGSRTSPVKTQARQPAPSTGKLRVMALGGLEEVGRNMTLLEYNKEIVIIDMGLQFPEEDMPGIDYIIPNTAYLED